MIVTAYEIDLYFLESHHLKEKRRILKSLIERSRRRFNLAISEIGQLEHWNYSTIGIAFVSNSQQYNDRVIDQFLTLIEEWYPIEIIQVYSYE